MFLYHLRAAGQGLVQLFFSSPVQSFFKGAALKELYPEKGIPTRHVKEGVCKMFTYHQTTLHVCTTYYNYEYLYHSDSNLLLLMPIGVAEWRTEIANSHHSIERWYRITGKPSKHHKSTSAKWLVTAGQGVVSQKQQLVKTEKFIRITYNSENLSINMVCIDDINQLMELYIGILHIVF